MEGAPEGVATSLERAMRSLRENAPAAAGAIRAVGHRVVHGGMTFRQSVRVDATLEEAIRRTAELAPLHNPPALAALDAARRLFPDVPHVAAFDTAFFASLAPRAHVYPLPYRWYEEWGIRRFGFHGLSHAYCAGRAAEMLPERSAATPELRLIVLHLGNGCSAAAIRGSEPVATTMGFTPLEGLMMGTRSGSVDPGILVHLIREHGLDAESLDRALHHESGLLGVSGLSGDYREVERAAREGNERARLALTIYADRIRATVGALAVTLGGVDALVFTAGVGEHARELRSSVCAGLEVLGIRLDDTRNANDAPDADVSSRDSGTRILILETREALMLARETRAALRA